MMCPRDGISALACLVIFLVFWGRPAIAQECAREDVLLATTLAPPHSARSWKDFEAQSRDIPSGDLNLLVVGDSLAADWGMAAPQSAAVYNYGVKGDRTQNVLWRLQEPKLGRLRPKNVLVIVGTNNLAGGEKRCGIVAGVQAVFARLVYLWPEANIVYLQIPPRGLDFRLANGQRIAINEQLAKTEHIKTINMDDQISCRFTAPCENYQNDNLHFSAIGYNLLNREISPLLRGQTR